MGYLISETTKEEPESMNRYRNLENDMQRILMIVTLFHRKIWTRKRT